MLSQIIIWVCVSSVREGCDSLENSVVYIGISDIIGFNCIVQLEIIGDMLVVVLFFFFGIEVRFQEVGGLLLDEMDSLLDDKVGFVMGGIGCGDGEEIIIGSGDCVYYFVLNYIQVVVFL